MNEPDATESDIHAGAPRTGRQAEGVLPAQSPARSTPWGDVAIRHEVSSDAVAVRLVQEAAFPTPAEAQLVELLREHERLTLSLVAEPDGHIVGHVALSEVVVEAHDVPASADRDACLARGLGLAPLAVLPGWQGRGIGSALVRAACQRAGEAGYDFVVLLGEPSFYGRLGFVEAAPLGLKNEYGATTAFQVLPLTAQALPRGLVRYAAEFGEVFPP